MKKLAILGLVSQILVFLLNFFVTSSFWLFNILMSLGFILYFSIFLCRLYKHKGNINLAKILAISGIAIQILSSILACISTILRFGSLDTYIYCSIPMFLYYLIWLLYLVNIFYNKDIVGINKKVLNIAYILYLIIVIGSYFANIIPYTWLITCVGTVFILPYFYKYYDLLKGGENHE